MACDTHNPFLPGQTIMDVKDLFFDYGPKEVLRGISAEIVAGRLCGLLGPNGSGKSTFFKCCLGYLKPKHGTITLGGRPLAEFSHKHLASHVAYVPQEYQSTFPFLVREMVALGRTPHKGIIPVLSKQDRVIVEHALERVGLRHLSEESYNHLSGGQKQLVLLARALAQEALLLFLDEPTSSLDFSNQLVVWDTVREIVGEGLGAVICCHDPNHIVWFCEDMMAIKDGRLLASGPVKSSVTKELLEQLYDRPINTGQVGEHTFIYP